MMEISYVFRRHSDKLPAACVRVRDYFRLYYVLEESAARCYFEGPNEPITQLTDVERHKAQELAERELVAQAADERGS